MAEAMTFDPAVHTIGLSRTLDAEKVPARPDPPVPLDGFTFGVASMRENPPHGGELHPDGDEVLYLISGKVRVVFPEDDNADIELLPGNGLVVPRGVWHRVDILEPCQIVYVTPGPNNRFRDAETEVG